MRILVVPAMSLSALAPAQAADGQTEDVGATIEHLLAWVSSSDATFIRNDKRYSGKNAAKHMRKKYDHFRKEIQTPEDFIRLAATASLISGKAYLVQLPGGETIPCSRWLRGELDRYRANPGSEDL